MNPFSFAPLDKDLVTEFETLFGVFTFDISKDSNKDFEDFSTGWSFSLGNKNNLSLHKIIRVPNETVYDTLAGNIDFVNTYMSLVGVLITNVKPSSVRFLDYCDINYQSLYGYNGPEMVFSWFPVSEGQRRVDSYYVSVV